MAALRPDRTIGKPHCTCTRKMLHASSHKTVTGSGPRALSEASARFVSEVALSPGSLFVEGLWHIPGRLFKGRQVPLGIPGRLC